MTSTTLSGPPRSWAEQPDLIRQVHLGYFRRGPIGGITGSYQATIPGLTAKGYSRQEARTVSSVGGVVSGGPEKLVGPGGPG